MMLSWRVLAIQSSSAMSSSAGEFSSQKAWSGGHLLSVSQQLTSTSLPFCFKNIAKNFSICAMLERNFISEEKEMKSLENATKFLTSKTFEEIQHDYVFSSNYHLFPFYFLEFTLFISWATSGDMICQPNILKESHISYNKKSK